MVRLSLVVAVALFVACGPLTPPGADAGTGGGGVSGGGGGTTGGGSAQTGGGGAVATGGGAATGGGGGAVTGGGGGASTGGGGGALAPLTWASMSMVGATSSSGIVGLSGAPGDLWAIQEYGDFFHSSGGAFNHLFKFSGGAKDLYVSGNTVVVALYRAIRWCTGSCTTEADFSEVDLITLSLFAEATCGMGSSSIAVIVSDTSNNAQLFEWNGAGFTRTNSNLGVTEPQTCWYDAAGGLNVAGRDGVVRVEGGAATPQDPGVGSNATYLYGGAEIAGTSFIAAGSGKVARRLTPTGAWTLVPTTRTPTLRGVGGLLANEVFVLGYYDSTIGNGYRWDGAMLRPVGDLLPGMGQSSLVRRIIATSPTELYVGGNNSTGPVIVRGRR